MTFRACRSIACFAAIAMLAAAPGCATGPAATSPANAPGAPAAARSVGSQAAEVALAQLGVPYRYGGQTPASGFDCSGLVHYAYLQVGKALPRTTRALWDRTETVPPRQLAVGDLLFFSIEGKMQHVGLYIGDDRFVHAPSSGKTVSVGSLDSAFYRHALLRAGRP